MNNISTNLIICRLFLTYLFKALNYCAKYGDDTGFYFWQDVEYKRKQLERSN